VSQNNIYERILKLHEGKDTVSFNVKKDWQKMNSYIDDIVEDKI